MTEEVPDQLGRECLKPLQSVFMGVIVPAVYSLPPTGHDVFSSTLRGQVGEIRKIG
ncbi:MAG: hypothetical protein OXF56_06380 [Rhodobacteraceae bacterium]|nr:hypothetical protein [Paracoccaceae bacterium]